MFVSASPLQKSGKSQLIVGGETSAKGRWPWQLSLQVTKASFDWLIAKVAMESVSEIHTSMLDHMLYLTYNYTQACIFGLVFTIACRFLV